MSTATVKNPVREGNWQPSLAAESYRLAAYRGRTPFSAETGWPGGQAVDVRPRTAVPAGNNGRRGQQPLQPDHRGGSGGGAVSSRRRGGLGPPGARPDG